MKESTRRKIFELARKYLKQVEWATAFEIAEFVRSQDKNLDYNGMMMSRYLKSPDSGISKSYLNINRFPEEIVGTRCVYYLDEKIPDLKAIETFARNQRSFATRSLRKNVEREEFD